MSDRPFSRYSALPSQLYFAVESRALHEAIAGALAGDDGPTARLHVDERLLTAHVGVVKQEQVRDRWSPLVPPDTWETVDASGFSAHRIMPVERLLRLLAGRVRFLGAVAGGIGGRLLVPLGFERGEADEATQGRLLSRTLDPPAAPDEDENFGPDLSLISSSQAAHCRRIVDTALDRYLSVPHETFGAITRYMHAETREEGDRLCLAFLATLHTVTRALEAGEDVLVTRML